MKMLIDFGESGSILLTARSVGSQVTHARLGPGRRVVECANQFPERAFDAADKTLEVGRHMGGDLDPDRGRWLIDPAQPARQAR